MCNFCSVIAGGNYRLNGMAETGTPVVVSYGFSSNAELGSGLIAADLKLREAARTAAEHIGSVAGMVMVEVDAAVAPMIEVRYNTLNNGVSYATYPYSSAAVIDTASEVSMSTWFSSFAVGTFGYEILLHEFGHAFGLKHPFETPNALDPALDNTDNTVMSYTTVSGPQPGFQEYDRAALQALYGADAAFAGASVRFNENSGFVHYLGTGGENTLVGVNSSNFMAGRGGGDTLTGRDGDDIIRGNAGDDSVAGHGGNDELNGDSGNDWVNGGNGHDILRGGFGADRLRGGNGRDTLSGGDGDDVLRGQGGRDWLIGGGGDDTMFGGGGGDRFIVTATPGTDVIEDFDGTEGDRLAVHRLEISASEALARLTPRGDDMVFDTGAGDLVLAGEANTAFFADDFIV